MSAPPYMPLYIGDYLADTVHLNGVESGAYLHLLMCMWRAGGALPNDPEKLARFCKLTTAQFRRVEPEVMPMFTVEEGQITHPRLTAELRKYEVALTRRVERASSGGIAKSLKNQKAPPASSTVQAEHKRANHNSEPYSKNKEGDANASPVGLSAEGKTSKPWERDPHFAALWTACTQEMRGRAKSREKTWPEWLKARRGRDPEEIVRAMGVYLAKDPDVGRTGGPGLHIWLRDATFDLWLTGDDQAEPPELTQAEKDAHDAKILGKINAIAIETARNSHLPSVERHGGGVRGNVRWGLFERGD